MTFKRPFTSARELDVIITNYFSSAEDKPTVENEESNGKTIRIPPGPPTLAGLAFQLGFKSLQDFEAREAKGKFATRLQRARLYIEAIYESRLHSSAGAIYALKTMGHGEKIIEKTQEVQDNTLTVEIIGSGPQLAGSEKEVSL